MAKLHGLALLDVIQNVIQCEMPPKVRRDRFMMHSVCPTSLA